MRIMNVKMNCCAVGSGRGVRLRSFLGWVFPSCLLMLVPKCPLCIAAYMAAATGIGISVSTAAGIRYALVAACVALIVFAVRRSLRTVS